MLGNRRTRTAAAVVVLCALAAPAAADVQTSFFGAAKDNTIYESEDGGLSNGAGEYLFAGTTNQGRIRRALLQFDISAIPQGAIITGATLVLHHSLGQPNTSAVSLHRALGGWGEGTSDAIGNEGTGIEATPGDATWLHSSWNTEFWQTIGGDFDAMASATTAIGPDFGFSSWSSAGLVADLQAWLDGSAANHGWFLRGEEGGFGSAKRFATRENLDEALRPRLEVQWVIPAPSAAGLLAAAVLHGRRRRR
jgi:hypothetical protein